jgi:HEAT repeat protein
MKTEINQNKLIFLDEVLKVDLERYPETLERVVELLEDEDYFVKSKAYVTLKKIASFPKSQQWRVEEAIQKGLSVDCHMYDDKDEEFQLRALEVLSVHGTEDSIALLTQLLQARNPYLVRGSLVALSGIGGERAATVILSFGASREGRIMRREIMEEVLAYALLKVEDVEGFLKNSAKDNQMRIYLEGMELSVPPIQNFTVYPCNDYLAQKVKERGFAYRQYRRALGM